MVATDRQWISGFYRDLRALQENAFRKKCSNCGREFFSLDQFLNDTGPVRENSGLMETPPKSKTKAVGLFRNCTCGSTLMIECRDRRRTDLQGLRHRQAFERLLKRLIKKGVRHDNARDELLAIMRGESSPVLSNLGVSPEMLETGLLPRAPAK